MGTISDLQDILLITLVETLVESIAILSILLKILVVVLQVSVEVLDSFIDGLRLVCLCVSCPLFPSISRRSLSDCSVKVRHSIGVVSEIKTFVRMLQSVNSVKVFQILWCLTCDHTSCIFHSKLFSVSLVHSKAFIENTITNNT